ncbi:MAG: thiamine pyrophosphate-dependent enzyme [bacterium]|nr:thiamine pyrophosphate-dependent enzyme [bacterium]
MAIQKDFLTDIKPTWCPGCGNFGMWTALAQAYVSLGLEPHQVFMSFDIGCCGNGANWHNVYGFHSLHGRALPVATAVKFANHDLTVVAIAGDGGGLGEGGNHFLHASRRNVNMTFIIHNNERYSLTTGQTSPTTKPGQKTKTALSGAIDEPLNALQLALTAGATFVARGYSDEVTHLKALYEKAIAHPGFAVVEVIQPCVIFFDDENIRERYKPKLHKLEDEKWSPNDRQAAYVRSGDWENIAIGVFYQEQRPTYESHMPQLATTSLLKQKPKQDISRLMKQFQ